MRFVIYDDESLEPITVLNLPLPERDALERRIWRVPVPEEPSFERFDRPPEMVRARIVEIEFEPFTRQSPRYGRQISVFAFTRATELAMLLNPGWLPGQRGAVEYLQDQNDRLAAILMLAL